MRYLTMENIEKLVEMKNITKKFSGVTALDNISFDVRKGEVHVLLGENGAGKSTLMKILSGAYQPTSGSINLKGKDYNQLTPKDSYENGISIIYQELSVINELSVQENLFVGKLPTRKVLGVNLVDYNIGADKGGAVNMFDDFDIDYNAQKYLIETRCSGALIKPFSAIAVESFVSA